MAYCHKFISFFFFILLLQPLLLARSLDGSHHWLCFVTLAPFAISIHAANDFINTYASHLNIHYNSISFNAKSTRFVCTGLFFLGLLLVFLGFLTHFIELHRTNLHLFFSDEPTKYKSFCQ